MLEYIISSGSSADGSGPDVTWGSNPISFRMMTASKGVAMPWANDFGNLMGEGVKRALEGPLDAALPLR